MTSEAEIREILGRAKALFDEGRLQESREVLERGRAVSPDNAEIHRGLAYLYYQLGKYRHSEETFRKLIRLEPENLAAWSNLGLVYLKMGRNEDALLAFDEYLKRDPEDQRVNGYRGLLLKKMGLVGRRPAREEPETGPAGAPGEESGQAEAGEVDFVYNEEEAPGAADGPLTLAGWRQVLAGGGYGISPAMVSVRLERRLVFSIPSLVMYRGVVVFNPGPDPYRRLPRKYRRERLVLESAEGNGEIMLSHPAGGLVVLGLESEALDLNAHRLVAFDETLKAEWQPLGKDGFLDDLAVLRFSGRGRVVLAAGAGTSAVRVETGGLTFVRPSSAVAWSDSLYLDIEYDDDLKRAGDRWGRFLRFEGDGHVYLSPVTPA